MSGLTEAQDRWRDSPTTETAMAAVLTAVDVLDRHPTTDDAERALHLLLEVAIALHEQRGRSDLAQPYLARAIDEVELRAWHRHGERFAAEHAYAVATLAETGWFSRAGVAAPAPPRSRAPVLLSIITGAVLLVGLAAYLATRGTSGAVPTSAAGRTTSTAARTTTSNNGAPTSTGPRSTPVTTAPPPPVATPPPTPVATPPPPTTNPPPTGTSKRYRVVESVPIRAAPTNASEQRGVVPRDTRLMILCTVPGEHMADGRYIPTADWNLVEYDGVQGYVADYFMETNKDINLGIIPPCT